MRAVEQSSEIAPQARARLSLETLTDFPGQNRAEDFLNSSDTHGSAAASSSFARRYTHIMIEVTDDDPEPCPDRFSRPGFYQVVGLRVPDANFLFEPA
jgi:hypothetical protein